VDGKVSSNCYTTRKACLEDSVRMEPAFSSEGVHCGGGGVVCAVHTISLSKEERL